MKIEKDNIYKRFSHSNYDLFYYLFYNHCPGWTAELLLSIIVMLPFILSNVISSAVNDIDGPSTPSICIFELFPVIYS